MRRKTYLFAFISMAIAIALGALGAHRLKADLDPEQLESFKTGVFYQIVHALALIGLLSLFGQVKSRKLNIARNCLIYGPVLFSGSIYMLSTHQLTGLSELKSVLGPVTPIGGVIMITGWVLLAVATYNIRFNNES